ncbi:hypothetical protein M9434_001352 [Picochlorum sp. BPE23]|nr:hypothetical protein M9434_001352 [Picochlorum sp. BPE23]
MSNSAVVLKTPDMEDPAAGIEVKEVEKPSSLGPKEVLCQMRMRPINPADIFSLMGVYPGFDCSDCNKEGTDVVPGLEGVGVVEDVGEGVSLSKGQRVVGIPFPSVEKGNGTWQKYIVAKEDDLFPVPDSISDEHAAQFYINPVTCVGMLDELSIPQGEYLLQTAAGSVLGRMLIQICKYKGIKTINVVRREEQAQEILDIGGDHVIVSQDGSSIQDKVMEITGGKGAYAAVECVGGTVFKGCASSLRASGTILIYGAMSSLEMTVAIPDVLFRGVTVRGFWLVPYFVHAPVEKKRAMCNEIATMMEQGIIVPYAGKVFPLEDVAKAIAHATAHARGGKVLLST